MRPGLPYAEMFGTETVCACGQTHRLGTSEVVLEYDAAALLPVLLRRVSTGRRVGVLMDARTGAAAGQRVVECLARQKFRAHPVTVADPHPSGTPVCDDATCDVLLPQVSGSDLLLAVGGGVINDLSKWLAARLGVPYVCFGTALSMNGYVSANVAATVDGLKTSVPARAPVALVADPLVLADAPAILVTAGFGDIMGAWMSLADWRLASYVTGDSICERAVEMASTAAALCLERGPGMAQRDPAALEALFHALVVSGAAMTAAGSSSPASGAEHAISHALDMMSMLDGAPHDLHGRQVGVATLVAVEIARRVAALGQPLLSASGRQIDTVFWGRLAGHVQEQYEAKRPVLDELPIKLAGVGAWDTVRRIIADNIRPADWVRERLEQAGAARCAEDILCSRERLTDALVHAHELRSRITILDIAHIAGVLPGQAEDIIATAM